MKRKWKWLLLFLGVNALWCALIYWGLEGDWLAVVVAPITSVSTYAVLRALMPQGEP